MCLDNYLMIYIMHFFLQAEKPNIFFKPVKVEINPNTPHLSDIKPSRYTLHATFGQQEIFVFAVFRADIPGILKIIPLVFTLAIIFVVN